MKHFAKLFAIVVAVLFSANIYAQDIASISETYNTAAAELKADNKLVALDGFKKVLQDATALGEEGQPLVDNCKNVIPQILLSLGRDNANAGDFNKALEYTNEALKLGKEYDNDEIVISAEENLSKILMANGNSLLNDGKYAESIDEYNKILAIDSTNATAYIRIGMAQAKLNNDKDAINAYNKAAELGETELANKQLASFYTAKTAAAYKAKNNAETLKNALKAEEYGNNPKIAKIGGIAAFNLNKYDSCIKLLEEVLEDNPNDLDASYFIARAYEAKGDKDKALANYKKIVGDQRFKAFAESKIKELGA